MFSFGNTETFLAFSYSVRKLLETTELRDSNLGFKSANLCIIFVHLSFCCGQAKRSENCFYIRRTFVPLLMKMKLEKTHPVWRGLNLFTRGVWLKAVQIDIIRDIY